MATVLFMIGAVVAAVLLGLLVLTLLSPRVRIWPTPSSGSWQSYVFWPLFRSLNVLCFAVAITDRTDFLGLPAWSRLAAVALLAVSIALFIYSFRVLGRNNSYGAQDGLVTGGIYAGPAIRKTRCSSLSTAASRLPQTVRRPTCFARP